MTSRLSRPREDSNLTAGRKLLRISEYRGTNPPAWKRHPFERKLLQINRSAINIDQLTAFILRHRLGIATAALLLTLDQAAKFVIVRVIPVGESWPTAGYFHPTHAANLGSTLDLFSGNTVMLIAASAAGIGLLMALYCPRPKTGARPQVAFGMMLAGAMGNLIDRLAFGHVIDFIDILPWFIFNVADIAILFGLMGFAWDIPDVTARLLTESQERA